MRKKISTLFLIITMFGMVHAQQKALIIIDIQNDYFEGGNMPLVGSHEAAIKAKDVLKYFREKNLPIVHIQHISNREGAAFFLPGTKGVEIYDLVRPVEGEQIIEKHFPNSFLQTELQSYLSEKGITELVICGMMTSMCVDATVRAAKDFGYNCTLIADACAAPDLSFDDKVVGGLDVNTAIVGALNYYYARAIKAEDFIKE